MSVLVIIETEKNKLKRNAAEVASYGVGLAADLKTSCSAIAFHSDNADSLGQFGISKVAVVSNVPMHFDANTYADTIAQHVQQIKATHLIVSSSADAKFLAPLLAAKLNAAYVPNVVALPSATNPLTVKRTAFTNKAFANTTIEGSCSIIGVGNNTFGAIENPVSCDVQSMDL